MKALTGCIFCLSLEPQGDIPLEQAIKLARQRAENIPNLRAVGMPKNEHVNGGGMLKAQPTRLPMAGRNGMDSLNCGRFSIFSCLCFQTQGLKIIFCKICLHI